MIFNNNRKVIYLLPVNNFVKYLQESKDGIDDKAVQMSVFIYKNDLLNVLYEVNSSKINPIARINHIGAPNQVIDILSHAVTVPLKQIEIEVEKTPVLRRVYKEKKSIYFKKLPELVAGLVPDVKYQQQAKLILNGLGITDVAAIPVDVTSTAHKKEYILAVLGPLDDDQKKFIKDVALEFANYYSSFPF